MGWKDSAEMRWNGIEIGGGEWLLLYELCAPFCICLCAERGAIMHGMRWHRGIAGLLMTELNMES